MHPIVTSFRIPPKTIRSQLSSNAIRIKSISALHSWCDTNPSKPYRANGRAAFRNIPFHCVTPRQIAPLLHCIAPLTTPHCTSTTSHRTSTPYRGIEPQPAPANVKADARSLPKKLADQGKTNPEDMKEQQPNVFPTFDNFRHPAPRKTMAGRYKTRSTTLTI